MQRLDWWLLLGGGAESRAKMAGCPWVFYGWYYHYLLHIPLDIKKKESLSCLGRQHWEAVRQVRLSWML